MPTLGNGAAVVGNRYDQQGQPGPLEPKRLSDALAELQETARAAIQATMPKPEKTAAGEPLSMESVEAKCNRCRLDIVSTVREWFQDGHLTPFLKTGRREWEELPSGRYWLAPSSKGSIARGVATSYECPWDGGILYINEAQFDALALAYITRNGLKLDSLPERFPLRALASAGDLAMPRAVEASIRESDDRRKTAGNSEIEIDQQQGRADSQLVDAGQAHIEAFKPRNDKTRWKIDKVLGAAQTRFSTPYEGNKFDKTPGQMAAVLSKDQGLNLGFAPISIKKILEGSYPPMVRRGIKSPYAGNIT
jgi:hypothetical protein